MAELTAKKMFPEHYLHGDVEKVEQEYYCRSGLTTKANR
jgi:hypothetical protein